MSVIYDLTENHIHQLNELYQHEWWTKGRTLSETKQCLAGSQICIGLLNHNQELVAFARLLTDYTFKVIIFDVIVSRQYRKDGLGKRLVELIKGHPKLSSVKSFELYCLPELMPFYESLGFSGDVGKIKLMRCVNA